MSALEERRFKVLKPDLRPAADCCPGFVPWAMIAPHEAMAKKNHDQDLEKLHSRGGLCPTEIYLVMNGIRWGDKGSAKVPNEQECVDWLNQKIVEYYRIKNEAGSTVLELIYIVFGLIVFTLCYFISKFG